MAKVTLAELLALRENPNAARFLNMVAHVEGTEQLGYNTLFGNKYFADLSRHPNVQQKFTQTDKKTNSTTAAGRYQFIKPTWDSERKKYGINDFSPISQDVVALSLAVNRGALPCILAGDLKCAANKVGGEWAGMPSSTAPQPKKSWKSTLERDYATTLPSAGAAPPSTVQGALGATPESITKALQDLEAGYQVAPEPAFIPQSTLGAIAKIPNSLDDLYGYNPTLTPALGAMTSPTPSTENIGVMSPLASVLFKG